MGKGGGANAILTVLATAQMAEASKALGKLADDAEKSFGAVEKGASGVAKPVGEAGAAMEVLGDSSDKSGGKMAAFAAVSKKAALGAAAMAPAIISSTKAANESQRSMDVMSNAFKNTGNFAGQSEAEIAAYTAGLEKQADVMSIKNGVDQSSIMAAQEMLSQYSALTTVGARNENMMARVTQASIDMAASGFGSVESSAKALGKAMNDPIKGMTALGKKGVEFSAEQKEMVTTMVASGDQMGAMNLVLGEVTSQMGGAAAESATFKDKLGGAFTTVAEIVGNFFMPIFQALIPAVKDVVAAFVPLVLQLVQDLAPIIKSLTPLLEVLANIISRVLVAALKILEPILAAVGDVFQLLIPIIEVATKHIERAGNIVKTVLTPPVKIVETALSLMGKALEYVVKWLQKFIDWCRKAAGAAADFARKLNPFSRMKLPGFGGSNKQVANFYGAAPAAQRAGGRQVYAGRQGASVNIAVQAIDPWESARAIKRALEGYDVSVGRTAGRVLPKAW